MKRCTTWRAVSRAYRIDIKRWKGRHTRWTEEGRLRLPENLLTTEQILDAVRVLRENNVPPDAGGYYWVMRERKCLRIDSIVLQVNIEGGER